MKCSGWGFEEVDEEKIVLVTPDGEVLHGSGRRHIECPIHTEIMAHRPSADGNGPVRPRQPGR
jgi:L-fuculose-phosphate aldolase